MRNAKGSKLASQRSPIARAWREWLRSVLVLVLAITAFRSAIADWNDVPTGSMRPTILEGDRIVVNKLAYDLKLPYAGWRLARWDDPARGDIVVLFSPGDGKRLVKRVVGLPGDRIAVRGGALIVNGEALRYSPLDPGMVTGIDLADELPILADETRRRRDLAPFPGAVLPHRVEGEGDPGRSSSGMPAPHQDQSAIGREREARDCRS